MSDAQTTVIKANDLDQVLKNIQSRTTSYVSEFWVPSLKRGVKFREINTSQQKRLVKSVIDSPIFNTEFIFTLREVLRENCIEDVNIDNLTILDKLMIALGLRISCVGSNFEIEVQTDPENPQSKKQVSANLSEVYEIAKKHLSIIEKKTIEDDNYKIECFVPSVLAEYLLEKEVRSQTNPDNIKDYAQFRTTVGDAFIGEVVKYVNAVSVKDGGKLTPIDWNNLTFTNRIKVVETFDAKRILKPIIDYIKKVQEEVNKIELLHFKLDGKDYERRLTIDGNFFMIS